MTNVINGYLISSRLFAIGCKVRVKVQEDYYNSIL